MNDYGEIDLGTAATERACDAITLEIVRGALRATRKASFRHDLRAASLPGVGAGALRFGFRLGHIAALIGAVVGCRMRGNGRVAAASFECK